jgi:hypothetical protein
MSPESLNAAAFSPDVLDFLRSLYAHEVEYLVVGGEAVIYYGYARLTGDIDLFYNPTHANAQRLFAALREFWQGEVPGVGKALELCEPGVIIQFGVPPNRIDLLSSIDGVTFEDAWPNRTEVPIKGGPGGFPVWFIGRLDLMLNKRHSARPKDLDDLRFLEDPR